MSVLKLRFQLTSNFQTLGLYFIFASHTSRKGNSIFRWTWYKQFFISTQFLTQLIAEWQNRKSVEGSKFLRSVTCSQYGFYWHYNWKNFHMAWINNQPRLYRRVRGTDSIQILKISGKPISNYLKQYHYWGSPTSEDLLLLLR